MALLGNKTIQMRLNALGFRSIDGKTLKVDGIIGSNTANAIRQLQRKYFTRSTDVDGKYGRATDILLRNAWTFRTSKYFKLEEFKCNCGGKFCNGFPVLIAPRLVAIADALRDYTGAPTTVTSGIRCVGLNNSLLPPHGNAIKTSKHLTGEAVDLYNVKMNNVNNRKSIIDWIASKSDVKYVYGNGYYRNLALHTRGSVSAPAMGSSIHVNI